MSLQVVDDFLKPRFVNVEPPEILVVEDDITMRPLIEYLIYKTHPQGRVVWAKTEEAADALMKQRLEEDQPFDLVVADVFLAGDRTGIDLWRKYNTAGVGFVFVSATTPTKFKKLIGNATDDPVFLQKPLQPDDCIFTLKLMLGINPSV